MLVQKEIPLFSKTSRILQRGNGFIYLLPNPALRALISNYTITFPSKDILSDRYTVLPHASATLVFSCDERGLYGNLFGPLTKACVVGGLANHFDMLFIIEFQPAGLYAFTGVNQKELTDQVMPFELINPSLNRLLLETLVRTCHLDELIVRLDWLLLENIHTAYPAVLSLAKEKMLESSGIISTKELSACVYYSERHLNRIFEHYLGLNAKTFSRTVRINKAIRLMQNPQNSITFASHETGFYDLPHFIHDFKSVCGLTPREYRENMSDFYNEIAKF